MSGWVWVLIAAIVAVLVVLAWVSSRRTKAAIRDGTNDGGQDAVANYHQHQHQQGGFKGSGWSGLGR